MATLVTFEFPFQGPFGAELAAMARELAASIAQEPGLKWKIWTEDAALKTAGGVYLFETNAEAENYIKKHSARLSQFGVANPRVTVLSTNDELSAITRGPLL